MDVLKDQRFSGIVKDPRFKKIPTKHTKTKIDKRFHGLFSGKDFKRKHLVDKRGSLLDHKNSENYQKFYQLDEQDVKANHDSSDDDVEFKECEVKESDGGSKGTETLAATNIESESHSSDEEDKEPQKDTDEESGNEADDVKPSLAMKELPGPSDDEESSTTTDTEASDNEQEDEIDHHWQELDADAPRTSDVTQRLAVCNMNWDRLRAEDFFVVFNSFKPPGGVINSIKIYPSEFGLERMEKEKLHGPAELIEKKLDSNEDNTTSGTKGSRFHREKLRQYQINRLKYFFAVVDCDSPQTADSLYVQLNGMEFENSGCILDLRFIPDGMTFEQEPVSVATSVPSPSDYKPSFFVTSALNQVKVDLTWDETDPRRKEVLEKAFTDPESIEKDLREYLASPSESEDETEELEDTTGIEKLSSKEVIARYKGLVKALEEKEKGKENEEEFDMEITWESGLKEKTEKLVKEKALKENLTPFEEALKKKKELIKLKKEKMLNAEEEEEDDDDYDDDDDDDDGSSSAEESVLGKDQRKRVTFKVPKKNKLKSQEDSDEKKIAELTLLMCGTNEQDSPDSDDSRRNKRKMKKKKKNKEEKKQDSFMEPIDDPRFAALYTNPDYHIDPSCQNLKENVKSQIVTKVTQKTKYGGTDQVYASREFSEEADFIESSKVETRTSVEVADLKRKVGKFFKDFQEKKELQTLRKKRNGGLMKTEDSTLMDKISEDNFHEGNSPKKQKKKAKRLGLPMEGHSSFMADASLDALSEVNSSKKRKKKKVRKQETVAVDHMSSDNAGHFSGSNIPAACGEDDDVSDILIFSGNSTKEQTSAFSSEAPYSVNSVRKKAKKCRTS